MLAPGIEIVQASNAIGFGLRATCRFGVGDIIWQESGFPRGRQRSWQEVCSIPEQYRKIYKHFMYQVARDGFESLPQFDVLPLSEWEGVWPGDPAMFMNHSCDPSCWYSHPDRFEFIARRAILPGDRITYDYAMTETVDDQNWKCICGTARCRGRILATDWQLPQVRLPYWGHVARHVQDLMESLGSLDDSNMMAEA